MMKKSVTLLAALLMLAVAAAQGNARAEINLGVTYFFGQGVPQDGLKAIYWWKKAAAQGGKLSAQAQEFIILG